MTRPRVWPVFLAYLLAFLAIVAFTVTAAAIVRGVYPELPEGEVFSGLPGLLAGGIAASTALLTTLLWVVRPFEPAALRLVPGRETGPALAAMIVGTLAWGQALDSATAVAGLSQRGAMATIRRTLESAAGPELFAAVIVIGLMAGAAEEIFFRGYMQTALRERWSAPLAIVVTSAAFGVLHLDWLHSVLAMLLGLWLGFITERAGSALPAVVAHVVNNVLFTLLTAARVNVESVPANLILGGLALAILVPCAIVVARLGR
jgi:membrane protease YdiL (CAAX protease family)